MWKLENMRTWVLNKRVFKLLRHMLSYMSLFRLLKNITKFIHNKLKLLGIYKYLYSF